MVDRVHETDERVFENGSKRRFTRCALRRSFARSHGTSLLRCVGRGGGCLSLEGKGFLQRALKETIARRLEKRKLLVRHRVPVLLDESFDIVCHVMGVVGDGESILVKARFLEYVLVNRLGQLLVKLVGK